MPLQEDIDSGNDSSDDNYSTSSSSNSDSLLSGSAIESESNLNSNKEVKEIVEKI